MVSQLPGRDHVDVHDIPGYGLWKMTYNMPTLAYTLHSVEHRTDLTGEHVLGQLCFSSGILVIMHCRAFSRQYLLQCYNALMASLKPQSNGTSYSIMVIGTLAVDGWAVTRRGLGGLGLTPLSRLLALPNVTPHPSTASVPASYHSMWQVPMPIKWSNSPGGITP